MPKSKAETLNYVAVMGRDGPLPPAYFAKRESDSFFIYHVFSSKFNILNLGDTFEWIYYLMEILNILIIIHFEDTLIGSVKNRLD